MKKVFITALLFHCIALSVIAQVPNYVPSNGLVGWWPFNGNANDQSGYGYHGAVTGATLSTDRFGTINSCYEFLGQTQAGSNNTVILTDNVIDIPNYTPTFTTQLTISVWANTYSSSNSSFLQRRTNNDIDYAVEFWNGNPSCHFGNIGVCSSSNTVGFNEWHNYTYVYDGSNIKIYIDGVLSSTCPTSGNIGNNTNIMNFGKYIYYGGFTHYFFFNGKLDDIGIWDRALSPSEIENLYSGFPIQCSIASLPSNLQNGIVGYWPFCGNANDESGNGNNGAVNGATLNTDRFGNTNSAYLFNGSSDYISLPSGNSTSLNITGDYTISFWIKTSDNSCLLTSLGDNVSSPPNAQGYLTGINGGNVGIGKMGAATRGSWNGTNTNTIADNNWHHIVALLKADTLKFFIDNVMDNQIAGVLPPLSWNGNRVLGCRHDLFMTTATNFGGILDDIAIYNRALDTGDIDSLFNSPNPMIGAFTSACDTLYNSTSNITWYGQTVKTNDGNIVSVGTENHIYNWSNGDIFLNKYDTAFNLIWTKKFYVGGGMDVASGVLATSDGGYLIHSSFGNSNPAGNYSAGYIIKTDALGNQQWVQTLTGQSYGDNYGVQAVENSSGEFVCYGHVQHHAGCSSYSTRITKLSSSGAIVWSNCIQLNPDKSGGITKLAATDNYITAFNNPSNGTIELRKWNDAGNQIGLSTYQYSNQYFTGGAVKSCQTGGYFIYGQYNSTGNQKNAFIAKFDDSMNFLWESSDNTYDENLFSTMTEDNQGNIYCASRINNFNQQGDLAVAQFNSSGVYQNKWIFNGPSTDDYIQGIVILPNGDIICSGRSSSQGILVKFCGLGQSSPQCSSLPSNLTTGLVGYWPFCGNANDESGNGNNGAVNGATLVADRFGNPNGAYFFNGTSDFININNSPIYNFQSNNTLSLSYWINASTLSSSQLSFIINKQESLGVNQDGWNSNIESFYESSFRIQNGSNTNSCTLNSNPSTIGTNTNYHIVQIYDNGIASSYLNGVLVNQITCSALIGDNNSEIYIGKPLFSYYNSKGFNGVIDDIGIWNRALTQPEITQLFTGDTVPACSSLPSNLSSGLVGYWPFCGNANDESGNGNNGTVNGATLISDRFGNQSSAYSFNGINNYIEVPNSSSLVFPNSSQSFSFWINVPVLPNTFGCDMAIFSKTQQNLQSDPTGNSNTGFEVIFGEAPNSNLYHRYKNGSSSNWGYTQISKNMFVTNQWFHVVTIADKSKDSAYAYLNGVLIESKLMGVNTTIGSNALSLLMGKGYWTSNGVPSFYFNGKLDDIGIWNRALTPQEVIELYSDP
jgi:hypothetical protein